MNTEYLLDKPGSRVSLKKKVSTVIQSGQQNEFDRLISQNLIDLVNQLFVSGFTLGGSYSSLADEPLLNLPESWNLSLPVVKSSTEMDFYGAKDGPLLEGKFGVLQPSIDKASQYKPSDHDFFIIPAVGFSQGGYRLGRGVGYYDRYLKEYIGLKIGVSYSTQMVADLWQPEEHDIKLDFIVTEKFIVKVS